MGVAGGDVKGGGQRQASWKLTILLLSHGSSLYLSAILESVDIVRQSYKNDAMELNSSVWL